jgi:prolyl oligopeptidase
MNRVYLLLSLLLYVAASAQKYPATSKTPQTISKHGITYQDDYIWLEDMRSTEVIKWVNAQNKITQAESNLAMEKFYSLPSISKYYNQTSYRIPNKERLYYYSLLRRSEHELQTPMLFYKKKLDDAFIETGEPKFLL